MIDVERINFAKLGGLVPAVIQDDMTKQVLMLGFMDQSALQATLVRRKVVFWSRGRQRLWEKGEESGNTLTVISMFADCDHDSLLVTVSPAGPTCHHGTVSCFD